jgi:CubicO group peptidase (beta-lactamase class C family)/transcriptional regulator with XRE-family HTH domain/tRNA A-37 threonylcarbamoyl transferase component Bud32
MATDQPLTFATLLTRYRAALGLTQEELAERAGLSVRGLRDLERGVKIRPRAHTTRQLVDALELLPEDRAVFERVAHATDAAPRIGDTLPLGEYWGSRPASDLVAREEELERIHAALDAVAEGAGQLLLLSGELGIGKTYLLHAALHDARASGYAMLGAQCSMSDQHAALAAFSEALGGLAVTPPDGLRTETQRAWKRIAQLTADLPTTGGGRSGRGAIQHQEIFRAITDLLLLVSQSTPVVVVFDDLQWADEQSLLLLVHLARSTHGARVLLLGAFRDARVTDEHPALATMLQTLSRERLAERLTIRRLSLEETTRLVGVLMGNQPVSEEFATFAYRRTKGVPRLIEQLVRSLGGRLELQGEIGAGAMGRVFKAYDRERAEDVAAKLVLARSEIDLDTLLRFQQEGAVLARLDHPHIVQIYDTFAEEHASCIIMELLQGQSLGQILQDGPLSLARAKHLALQVADALAYAHSQEIVHRDIKPDNVMVLAGDQVKVTDFGIARILQPDTSLHTMATTGMRMGTPLYMAPEQIEGKQVDGRTDLYALGAMLYHLVTGRPPFEGSDALAVAVKHLQEEPVPPSQINPTIPADWDAVILKAMTKDPAKRFQSAHAMAGSIATLSEKPGLSTQTERRAHPVAVMGLVFAVLVAMAVVWTYAATSRPTSLKARLDAYLSGQAAQTRLSGTILVADKHGIILDKGYGYADRAAHIRDGPNTGYADIALTTNLSITELVSDIQGGSLRWDARICSYLPRCPPAWKLITIRSLVAGTSRLPDYYWGRPGNTVSQSLVGCQDQPLDPPSLGPVEYQVCTNLVAALLVEKVDNNPWGVDSIFQLAGMQNSGQLSDSIRSPVRAVDYLGSAPNSNTTYNDYVVAYTTAADEYSFDNALFGGKILSPRYLNDILAPRAPVVPAIPGIAHQEWGDYWESGDLFGHRVDFTYAEINRFLSVNMRFPGTGLTVILLSNTSGTDVRDIAIHAAAIALGIPVPSSSARTYMPRALFGTYQRIFTASEARAGFDPLGFQVGHTETLMIHPGYVRFVLVGNAFTDEYYRATPDGRVVLMGYLPANENNMCEVQPNITPPTGYFRWSLKGRALTITTVNGNHCGDRVAFFTGRWTRTG